MFESRFGSFPLLEYVDPQQVEAVKRGLDWCAGIVGDGRQNWNSVSRFGQYVLERDLNGYTLTLEPLVAAKMDLNLIRWNNPYNWRHLPLRINGVPVCVGYSSEDHEALVVDLVASFLMLTIQPVVDLNRLPDTIHKFIEQSEEVANEPERVRPETEALQFFSSTPSEEEMKQFLFQKLHDTSWDDVTWCETFNWLGDNWYPQTRAFLSHAIVFGDEMAREVPSYIYDIAWRSLDDEIVEQHFNEFIHSEDVMKYECVVSWLLGRAFTQPWTSLEEGFLTLKGLIRPEKTELRYILHLLQMLCTHSSMVNHFGLEETVEGWAPFEQYADELVAEFSDGVFNPMAVPEHQALLAELSSIRDVDALIQRYIKGRSNQEIQVLLDGVTIYGAWFSSFVVEKLQKGNHKLNIALFNSVVNHDDYDVQAKLFKVMVHHAHHEVKSMIVDRYLKFFHIFEESPFAFLDHCLSLGNHRLERLVGELILDLNPKRHDPEWLENLQEYARNSPSEVLRTVMKNTTSNEA